MVYDPDDREKNEAYEPGVEEPQLRKLTIRPDPPPSPALADAFSRVEAFGPHTLERAEAKRQILEGLKLLSIRSTAPRDWCKMGDQPYLTESGCMKFAEIYGVNFSSLRVDPVTYTDERGPVIEFYAHVTASYQQRFDSETGSASTAERFFNGKDADGKPARLPLSEVNRPNVRKKAVTNAKARAVKKLLGLTFTWDEVIRELKTAGKNPDAIPGVTYGDKSTGGRGRSTADGKGTLTPEKKELSNMIFEMAGSNQAKAAELLAAYTTFKGSDGQVPGKRSVKDMTDKHAAVTLKKVKEEYRKFQAEQAGEGGGGAGSAGEVT